jgi:hypothetical protein
MPPRVGRVARRGHPERRQILKLFLERPDLIEVQPGCTRPKCRTSSAGAPAVGQCARPGSPAWEWIQRNRSWPKSGRTPRRSPLPVNWPRGSDAVRVGRRALKSREATRSPKGNRPMRRLLSQAASFAVKAKGSVFQNLYRRLVPRLGHAKRLGQWRTSFAGLSERSSMLVSSILSSDNSPARRRANSEPASWCDNRNTLDTRYN